METDTDGTIDDEVHLKHLLLFVIDDILIFFVAEVARFEPEGDIVQELAILVLLRVEEEAEVVENIVKEVMDDDTSLDLAWESVDKLIVLLHLAEPVVEPVVLEVLVDLAVERVRQGLVTESSQ